MKLLLTGVIAISSSCIWASQQSISNEFSYNLTGSLQRQVFFKDEIFYKTTNNYEVQVRGSRVRIHTWNVPSYGVVQIKDFEFITDGKKSCFITAFDLDPKSVETSQKPGANKMFNTIVDIYTNVFPPNDGGYLGPIWIATASGSILKSQGNGEAINASLFMCPDWPDINGHKLRASWEVSTEPPYLPETLIEYSDAETFNIVSKFYNRWKKLPFPSIYESGYTNAVYNILSWTNIDNLKLPKHFQLKGFIPRFDGIDSSQLQVQVMYDGYIESVDATATNPIIFPDRFSAWSRIDEYRYGTINDRPIVYTSKSGDLLSKDEIIRRANHLDQVITEVDATATRNRGIVIAIMCASLLLPICVLIFRCFRRTQ